MVNVRVATDRARYGPGALVTMTLSVRSTAARVCRLDVGPSSPAFAVANAHGTVVWNNCYVNDRPGACAMYVVARTLLAGALFTQTQTWDQRTGVPLARDAVGNYRVNVLFLGPHAARVALTSARVARTTTVTPSDSGGRYRLRVGDHLVVRLSGASIYRWTVPTSLHGTVLMRTAVTVASATFVARSPGQSRVSAVGNPVCYPQCLAPSRLFVVDVTVTH